MVKIVSWNVNSIRRREPLILQFLKEQKPDVLCLQETKCQDEHFIHEVLLEAGYNSYFSGQKTYNGVAVLTHKSAEVVSTKLEGYEHTEARFLKVCVDGLCVYNVYIPNGQVKGSPAYYKQMSFLNALYDDVSKEECKNVAIAGDFNMAPYDRQVDFALRSTFLCDEELRKIWFKFIDLGFKDQSIDDYTWWDYRYRGNIGARIDAVLTSKCCNLKESKTFKDYRFGIESPSDHLPILVDVEY